MKKKNKAKKQQSGWGDGRKTEGSKCLIYKLRFNELVWILCSLQLFVLRLLVLLLLFSSFQYADIYFHFDETFDQMHNSLCFFRPTIQSFRSFRFVFATSLIANGRTGWWFLVRRTTFYLRNGFSPLSPHLPLASWFSVWLLFFLMERTIYHTTERTQPKPKVNKLLFNEIRWLHPPTTSIEMARNWLHFEKDIYNSWRLLRCPDKWIGIL